MLRIVATAIISVFAIAGLCTLSGWSTLIWKIASPLWTPSQSGRRDLLGAMDPSLLANLDSESAPTIEMLSVSQS